MRIDKPSRATRRWIVARPRLLEPIRASSADIVVLVAPAGYGKTTLARQLTEREPAVAWYQCRSSSNDVAKLARGIAKSLEASLPIDASPLEARLSMTARPDSEAEVLGDLLLTATADIEARSTWLVIDDYHCLVGSAAEDFVAQLATSQRFRTLVTSRVRPSWASARSRVYGDYLEIDASEMAMTQEEARAVFHCFDRDPPEKLLELAGGWPAVVSLVALTGSSGPAALAGAIEDFLVQEVCSGLDEDVLKALSLIAALPTTDRATANSVLGEGTVRRAIEQCQSAGILSGDDDALDMHPLIADVLRERLALSANDQLRPLFAAAARRYLADHLWDEAFEIVALLADRALFEEFLEEALVPSLTMGSSASVKRWLELAREREWDSHLVRLAQAELALREGFYIRAEAISADLAESASAEFTARPRLIAGRAAHLAGREEAALNHYRLAKGASEGGTYWREAAWGELTSAIDLELPVAMQLLAALEASQLANPEDQLHLASKRLNLRARFGPLEIVDEIPAASQLLQVVDDPLLRTSFANQAGYIAAITGEYELASSMCHFMMEDAERHRLAFVVPYAHFAMAVVAIATRDFSEGLRLLQMAREEGRRTADDFVLASAAAIRARALIAMGRFDDAAACASYGSDRLIRSMKAELMATRSVAVACAGDGESAVNLAREARAMSRAVEVPVLAACAEAISTSKAGGRGASLLASAAALVTRSSRYVDGFIAAYRGYPELARLIAADSDHRRWLAKVMGRANDAELVRVIGLSERATSSKHLSPREAEVFHLLRRGLTNKQIADALYISAATAKIHVKHICEKLEVRTRTEAVLKTPVESLSDLD